MPSADKLWQERYAQRYAQLKYQEDTWRELAFIDEPREICGEPVRTLTPHDVILLQGIASPLFYTDQPLRPAHVLQFIWALHLDNRGNPLRRLYKRARFIQRHKYCNVDSEAFKTRLLAVDAYLREMYVDAPPGKAKDNAETRRPLGVCWIASLLTAIGDVFGSTDPLTGRPLGQTPLPRLFQYLKSIRARAQGDKFKDYAPSDALLSEYLEELGKSSAHASS